MNRIFRAGIFAAVLSTTAILGLLGADAQDISDSHLKAARAAIAAIHATDQFDLVLPAASDQLKKEMIQKDPNLQAEIVDTVDEQTLAMVSRRADIEKEAALAYARAFTEQELNEIAAFYQTPTGKKLIEKGPQVMSEVMKSGEIWQRGVARDLAQQVAKAMRKNAPAQEQPATDDAPAQ